jgi:hypothetical protein
MHHLNSTLRYSTKRPPATNHPNFSLRFIKLRLLSRFNRGAFAAGNLPLLELCLSIS